MSKRDFYDVLGLSKSASNDEIKKAYRNLAKKLHPDVNSDANADEKFKEVNEAYNVLKDEKTRAMYDQYGHSGVDQSRQQGAGGFGGGFSGFQGFGDNIDIGDIFEGIFNTGFGSNFGKGARRSGPSRGGDTQMTMNISFIQAVKGTKQEIDLDVAELCKTCKGTGAATSSDIRTCHNCHGTGTEERRVGPMRVQTTCRSCNGGGKEILRKCDTCHGKGHEMNRKKIPIEIPAGVYSGDQIRVPNCGRPGNSGGDNGDLYIHLRVKEHKHLERDKNGNIILNLPLNYTDILNHKEIPVPSIDGMVNIAIPKNWKSSDYIRVKNHGAVIRSTTKKGDLYVRLQVHFDEKESHSHSSSTSNEKEFSKIYESFVRKF